MMWIQIMRVQKLEAKKAIGPNPKGSEPIIKAFEVTWPVFIQAD